MAFTRTPMRAETKVSAPRMSAAPIEANSIPNQDMQESPMEPPRRAKVSARPDSPQPWREAGDFWCLDGPAYPGTSWAMPRHNPRNWNRLSSCDAFT